MRIHAIALFDCIRNVQSLWNDMPEATDVILNASTGGPLPEMPLLRTRFQLLVGTVATRCAAMERSASETSSGICRRARRLDSIGDEC
jgi:hypothetical protein